MWFCFGLNAMRRPGTETNRVQTISGPMETVDHRAPLSLQTFITNHLFVTYSSQSVVT